ncbi:MAG: dihydrodipicolinate synthase family protein, partial [Flammeovirgaceae bacterium]
RRMKELALLGNYANARLEAFKLIEINGLMYEEGNPVGIKHLLKSMGLGSGEVRLPLVTASPELSKKIEVAFKR